MKPAIKRATDELLGGGVIAYPTEGVFGIGCLPDEPLAIARLLKIKDRDPRKGLILIASTKAQLDGWVAAESLDVLPKPDPRQPLTWIAPPGHKATSLLMGEHSRLAVRLTTNATAKAICNAVDSPITSSSANVSGRPVVRNKYLLQQTFGGLVDYIVPGECGPATGPSEIRILDDGRVLRPGTK